MHAANATTQAARVTIEPHPAQPPLAMTAKTPADSGGDGRDGHGRGRGSDATLDDRLTSRVAGGVVATWIAATPTTRRPRP